MRYPNIRTLESVFADIHFIEVGYDHEWVRARRQATRPTMKTRLRATWLVFIGAADALIWPGGQ